MTRQDMWMEMYTFHIKEYEFDKTPTRELIRNAYEFADSVVDGARCEMFEQDTRVVR